MLLKNICGLIDDLNTTSEDVILDTLDSIYETFHQRADMNEYDFILAMSKLIEMLINEKNKKIIESLLEALYAGVCYKDSRNVNFEPLIDFVESCTDMTVLEDVVNLLGASAQPQYINFLKSINVDDCFVQKAVKEAIFELNYSKK